MDSQRILHFAIEQKLKTDLKESSYKCINQLCKGESNVKEIIKRKSSVGLTALCDLLTVIILAMDEYQRINMKPRVAASDQRSEHKDMHNPGGLEKCQVGDKKEITKFSCDLAIDPSEIKYLEKEFISHLEVFKGKA
jgi:hypothetical protein